MKRARIFSLLVGLVVGAALALPQVAISCPSCYGAPDSPMTAGMNMAILSLLGVTGVVLLAIAAFIVYLWRRAAMLNRRFSNMLN